MRNKLSALYCLTSVILLGGCQATGDAIYHIGQSVNSTLSGAGNYLDRRSEGCRNLECIDPGSAGPNAPPGPTANNTIQRAPSPGAQ